MAKIMSKKEMIKEQERLKREKKQLESYEYQFNSEILWIIIFVVLFIVIVFLGINIYKGNINIFSHDMVFDDELLHDNKVMCGTLFDVSDKEYYVLAYDYSNKENDIFKTYISDLYQGELTIYELNTSEGMNKVCVADANKITNDIATLKLTSPILLHIKDHKIIKSYSTKKDIINIIG